MEMPIRQDYSPNLELRLVVNGQTWPIAKLGPDHFVPAGERFSSELEPCDGEIVMTVDGRDEHVWQVRVLHGAMPFDDAVAIEYKHKFGG